MLKKISFIVGVMVLTFLWIVPISFAEQSGDEYYGTSDVYGVYITAPDGTISYIWFWTEDARKMIMGDLTAPGTDVMGIPEGGIPIGKYPLDGPEKDSTVFSLPTPLSPDPAPDGPENGNGGDDNEGEEDDPIPAPKYMAVISCSGTAPGKSVKESIIEQGSKYNQIRYVEDIDQCSPNLYAGTCGDYILNVKCYEIVPLSDNEGTFFPYGGYFSGSKVHENTGICSMWYYCDQWYKRYSENYSGVTPCAQINEELEIAKGNCAVQESFAGGFKQF